jgi:hypothetical protein
MLRLARHQIEAIEVQSSTRLAHQMRALVREQPGRRQLAEDDVHWNRWWSQVMGTSQSRFALTPRRIAANAVFSLWFGHRYPDDPRCAWLAELLAADGGGIDFRLLDVDITRVLSIAGDWMSACHGDSGELYAGSMANIARLAGQMSSGRDLPWTPEGAAQCAALVWPQCHEMFTRGWLAAATSMVERVAKQCQHGEAVRWPVLLSVIGFGVDPWRDAAYPAMLRSLPSLLSTSPAELAVAVATQAISP